jgi:hypothetical protein
MTRDDRDCFPSTLAFGCEERADRVVADLLIFSVPHDQGWREEGQYAEEGYIWLCLAEQASFTHMLDLKGTKPLGGPVVATA